jgi:hypothetical protein
VLTLVHALDVAGYRAALGLFGPEFIVESILHTLHERRMGSPGIPPTARAESAQWLREHRTTKTPLPQSISKRKLVR